MKQRTRDSSRAWVVFLGLFAAILFASHAPLLDLPYFWDELGQFIPASLDILEHRAWVPRTALPNVHPPGVMAYLAVVWSVFGVSVTAARIAMLAIAALGVLFVFLCAIELSKGARGFPAFAAAAMLLACPLFFMQSMMAQLDMPAMTFTFAALWLFLRGHAAWSALACLVLVFMKETGALLPGIFGLYLLRERRYRDALLFAVPLAALAAWLAYLAAHTGHLLGNREFAHYNVTFQLHPARLFVTLIRRIYYLCFANFHWVALLILWKARRNLGFLRTPEWRLTGSFFLLHMLAVTLLGGAALERYVLPALPVYYIAAGIAWSGLSNPWKIVSGGTAIAGMTACLFINPPYPFPHENNLAMSDFVRLQQYGAEYVEANHARQTIVSAWPFPDTLRRREYGYVTRPIRGQGIENFNMATVVRARPEVLVLYSRTWEPSWGVLRIGIVRRLLERFYYYEPQITAVELARLDLHRAARYEVGGQWLEVYARRGKPGDRAVAQAANESGMARSSPSRAPRRHESF